MSRSPRVVPKILLDEGFARSASTVLRDEFGIRAKHLGELDMIGASDVAVIQAAIRQHMVLATLDSDFHRMIALTGMRRPSVIRFRFDAPKASEQASLVASALRRIGLPLKVGVLATVQSVTAGDTLQIRWITLPVKRPSR